MKPLDDRLVSVTRPYDQRIYEVNTGDLPHAFPNNVNEFDALVLGWHRGENGKWHRWVPGDEHQAMHRRAQRAEGEAARLRAWIRKQRVLAREADDDPRAADAALFRAAHWRAREEQPEARRDMGPTSKAVEQVKAAIEAALRERFGGQVIGEGGVTAEAVSATIKEVLSQMALPSYDDFVMERCPTSGALMIAARSPSGVAFVERLRAKLAGAR